MTAAEHSQIQFKKMTETPVPKLIVSLAIPTIISMLVSSIYNMADLFCFKAGNKCCRGCWNSFLSYGCYSGYRVWAWNGFGK